MFLSLTVRSQIVVKKFDNFVETAPVARPEPYDSLQDFRIEDNFIDNYKYIGQKIYLPSFSGVCNLYATHSSIIPASANKVAPISNKDAYLYNDFKHASSIKNIKTYIYKAVNTSFGFVNNSLRFEVCADKNAISDKYYTVLNILNREQSQAVISKIRKLRAEQNNDETTELDYEFEPNYYRGIGLYLLKNEVGDSIYTDNIGKPFISVAYFVKQQKLYDKKKFIIRIPSYEKTLSIKDFRTSKDITVSDKDEWLCEVALLEISKGDISYIFTDANGNTIVTESLAPQYQSYKFTLKDDYLKQEAAKKLKQEQFAILQKQRDTQAKLSAQVKASNYRKNCIDKFGPEKGELVAKGLVSIGMTKEMCLYSWGTPYDRSKRVTADEVYELFYYSYKRNLHFINDKLVQIEK
ncbi:hypothetical protein GCM10022407_28700 [Hymenobacter antarcticus]|uniref:WG containing repeat-containing protein n=2 Tax=Hymenobacter antarcticus TaxID=486270 RepID=A0ABP7QFN4_9BACT